MRIAALALIISFSSLTHAATPPVYTLRDVGVIGLFSHDIFAWDHKKEQNTENGRLDLSTIFDYDGGARWEKGGNPKNSENAPVYSIAMDLVDFYKAQMRSGLAKEDARRTTVVRFHKMVRDSFERTRQKSFPTVGLREFPTNIEQAALRGLHDVLPGRVKLYDRSRNELVMTDFLSAKTRLNEKELAQALKPFDGDYDKEYRNIQIPFGPKLDLKEIDRKFIEKFSPFKQADMLRELAEVGAGRMSIGQWSYVHHVDELFAKSICSEGNRWMPVVSCH